MSRLIQAIGQLPRAKRLVVVALVILVVVTWVAACLVLIWAIAP